MSKPDSAKTTAKKSAKLGRVLLVEDDPVLAMSLEDALRDGGAKDVVICHTMQATVTALDKGGQFDAIILDVHLADRSDGWAVAELVAMIGPKRPKIAFSTGSPEDIPPEIAEMGPVFEKPYDPQQLVEVLAAGRKRGLIARLLS
ncbi:response regulator [Aurantiacibacter poecillastricola]|uniref:response regulator n=1 Tax=Aurantiacibacter poecillastricola TaxID=3064385 RepID=UPI00273F99D2|nr:response regulator [Aurantiacibacter sp. 219JJ12-13]MDP5261181.1 response regulator [Aurantiacibacter sp. 219JJ12-13]